MLGQCAAYPHSMQTPRAIVVVYCAWLVVVVVVVCLLFVWLVGWLVGCFFVLLSSNVDVNNVQPRELVNVYRV